MADLLGTEEMRLEDNDALDLVTDLAKRANLLKPKEINSKRKIIFLSLKKYSLRIDFRIQ